MSDDVDKLINGWGLNKQERRHIEQLLAVERLEQDPENAEPLHPATVRALVRRNDVLASKNRVRLTERGRKTLEQRRHRVRVDAVKLTKEQLQVRERCMTMSKLIQPEDHFRRSSYDAFTLLIGEGEGDKYCKTILALVEDLIDAEEEAEEKGVTFTMRFEVGEMPPAKAKVKRQEISADNVVEMNRWRRLSR